jgi:hypothetical protein
VTWTALGPAAHEARLLDGWIGPEHFLLSVADGPGVASEALGEPRRGRIGAEEGVDLDAIVAAVRSRDG